MKFEKKDLNSCMLFKLRNKTLCVMLLRNNSNGYIDNVFYDKNSIEKGYLTGEASINNFNNELKIEFQPSFDIIAIKQLESTIEVLHYVLNSKEPEEWDWTEENKLDNMKNLLSKIEINIIDENNNMKSLNDILYEVSKQYNEIKAKDLENKYNELKEKINKMFNKII